MTKQVTISFVGNMALKELLERWSREDDRSVSATLRQIVEREAQRRAQTQRQEIIAQQAN
ncbi:MAG: hypothetical protein KDF65_07780 [Anaerolineae bacterium]|nr:hypothetical protein [Anaerolineae bacterium]